MCPFVEVSKCERTGELTISCVYHTENEQGLINSGWPVNRIKTYSDCRLCGKREERYKPSYKPHSYLSTVVHIKPEDLPEIEENAFFRAAIIMQGLAPGESMPKPPPKKYHQRLKEIALKKAEQIFSGDR